MPVMMPGSAIGRMRRSDTVSRPKKRERLTAAAASVPSTSATSVEIAATRAEEKRVPDVLPAPGDGEPAQRVAGRRELVALVLGGEGIEEDQRQRQMQEEQPRRRRRSSGEGRGSWGGLAYSASNAPIRLAIIR